MTAVLIVEAKKEDKWCRGVLEPAERFMVKRHKDEAELRRRRHASGAGGALGNENGGDGSRMETARLTTGGWTQPTG